MPSWLIITLQVLGALVALGAAVSIIELVGRVSALNKTLEQVARNLEHIASELRELNADRKVRK